jgi:hypothetical protein
MLHTQVNLKRGAPADDDKNVCVACAGTLLLEFGTLSRLTGNPVYEVCAAAGCSPITPETHARISSVATLL